MKRHVVIHLATAIGIATASSSTYAHHSYGAFFDLCSSVTIEGRVDSIEWKEPHVFIALTTEDGTAYRAEWTSLRGLSNGGVTTDALKAGDRVAVTGSPLKDRALIDPALRAQAPDPALKMVSALTQIRRLSDGWNWRGSDGMPPPECRK